MRTIKEWIRTHQSLSHKFLCKQNLRETQKNSREICDCWLVNQPCQTGEVKTSDWIFRLPHNWKESQNKKEKWVKTRAPYRIYNMKSILCVKAQPQHNRKRSKDRRKWIKKKIECISPNIVKHLSLGPVVWNGCAHSGLITAREAHTQKKNIVFYYMFDLIVCCCWMSFAVCSLRLSLLHCRPAANVHTLTWMRKI